MFGKTLVRDIINRSAENETDRRVFLKAAGLTTAGAAGAIALHAWVRRHAFGQRPTPGPDQRPTPGPDQPPP